MRLVHKDSRKPVVEGDELTDFRGDKAVFDHSEEPRHAGSTGRAYVRGEGYIQGFYPSVFNLEWEDDSCSATS
jgi:hypothetical protein